jgi:hypothetical protein
MGVNDLVLRTMDALLGWMLLLPRDAALFALGLLTTAILVGVRPLLTNQGLLGRCRKDMARLKALLKAARRAADSEALRRHRAVRTAIGLKLLRSELKTLLAASVPIALVATWAFQRLAFVPPAGGKPVVVTARFPLSADGQFVHIVPQAGVRAESGWIEQLHAGEDTAGASSLATWTLTAEVRPQAYDLCFRYQDQTYHMPVRVGQPTYESPVVFLGAGIRVPATKVLSGRRSRSDGFGGVGRLQADLAETKLFGRVPGIPWLGIRPWLLAYLLITIPAVSVGKRLLGLL